MQPVLYCVVPCYNEEAVLNETARVLIDKLNRLQGEGLAAEDSKIMFVDDGSKDKTWEIICSLHAQNPHIVGLKLAHNAGHQNALLAGLMTAKDEADIVISLDADLQDDVEVLDSFIKAYQQGNDIVYGVRSKRDKDSWFKRSTARWFYRVMRWAGADIIVDHADYRLMSRRALNALAEFKEVNLFLRGMVPLLGFKHTQVKYERHERFAGETKYPLRRMLLFSVEGISSFSVQPIRMITVLGLLMFGLSFLFLIYLVSGKIWGHTVPGWTAVMCSVWMLGGLQLFALGIIGEYIGKIYKETKARPRYIIEERTR